MFAETARIIVRQGRLKILGTSGNPVELVPTFAKATEFGDETILVTDFWNGLIFETGTKDSSFVDTNYNDGSIIRHCKIQGGGRSL